jgi:hypothetical protein
MPGPCSKPVGGKTDVVRSGKRAKPLTASGRGAKILARLNQRIKSYDSIPVEQKRAFRKPGSMNGRK